MTFQLTYLSCDNSRELLVETNTIAELLPQLIVTKIPDIYRCQTLAQRIYRDSTNMSHRLSDYKDLRDYRFICRLTHRRIDGAVHKKVWVDLKFKYIIESYPVNYERVHHIKILVKVTQGDETKKLFLSAPVHISDKAPALTAEELAAPQDLLDYLTVKLAL